MTNARKHAHRLIPASGPDTVSWSLRWDDNVFVLSDPEGQPVLEVKTARAHREY